MCEEGGITNTLNTICTGTCRCIGNDGRIDAASRENKKSVNIDAAKQNSIYVAL